MNVADKIQREMRAGRILLLIFAALLTAACSDTDVDEVFDESSSERIAKAIAEYNDLLTSASDGWLMKYYPEPESPYGGYSIFVRFDSDGTATAMCDLFGDSISDSSHFSLLQAAGVLLSFDDYNSVIHFFSTPNNFAGWGSVYEGLRGDFEFRVMSATADRFVLTGRKHGANIVMDALPTGTSFAEEIATLNAFEDSITFDSYLCVAATSVYTVEYSYRTFTFSDIEGGDPITVPFIVTSEGVEFYSPIVLATDTITGFRYDGGPSYEFSSIGGSAKMYGVVGEE